MKLIEMRNGKQVVRVREDEVPTMINRGWVEAKEDQPKTSKQTKKPEVNNDE